MVQASACDCGYQPRNSDCHEVVTGDGGETVLHVICYKCGKEWVE